MSVTLKEQKTRNYLWDNMKTFLIFMVVIGHFFESFPLNSLVASGFDYWIYTFHMPAFLFVSGFLSKGYCKKSHVRAEKIGYFLGYYIVFQVLFFLMLLVIDPPRQLTFFEPNIGLWYMVAMIFYYLLIPVAEKFPGYITMGVLVFLALTVGMDEKAGTYLTISRAFVFAPFFFAGYYCPQKLIDKLRTFKLRIVTGIFCAMGSVAIWVTMLLLFKRKNFPMKLFYGKHCYDAMGFSDTKGVVLRVIAWSVGILMILAMIMLTSQKKNIFSYIGQRSLQIYLLHFILIIILQKYSFVENFPVNNIWQCGVLIVLGTIFTLFLSLKVFSYPFDWIKTGVDKLLSLKKTDNT